MTHERPLETVKQLLNLGYLVDATGLQPGPFEQRLRFGDVAVALGYVSRRSVDAALAIQRLDREAGRRHRLVGQILVELQCMNQEEVGEVLSALVKHAFRERMRPTSSGRRFSWKRPLVSSLPA